MSHDAPLALTQMFGSQLFSHSPDVSIPCADPATPQGAKRKSSTLSDTSSIQRRLSIDLMRHGQGMGLDIDGQGTDKGVMAGVSARQSESQVGAKLNRGIASIQVSAVLLSPFALSLYDSS